MLNRDDLFSVHGDCEIETARNSDIVDQHRTTTAQPLAAALARAKQALVVQQFDQIAVRFDGETDRAAVQREANVAGFAHSSSSIGRPSAARKARSRVSGLMGSSVRRMPTASWIALAIAGETPKVEDSPTPLAPNGPDSCAAVTRSDSIGGTSRKPGIL